MEFTYNGLDSVRGNMCLYFPECLNGGRCKSDVRLVGTAGFQIMTRLERHPTLHAGLLRSDLAQVGVLCGAVANAGS